MLDLARDQRLTMPADDADALREYMRVDDARNLDQYLERFTHTLSVMQTAESMERVAYELAEDCAKEGVRYLETRYAPVLNVERGLTLSQAVEAPLRGLARAEKEYGIVARVIVCGIRNMSPEVSYDLARLAVDYKERGVVGFDLAGGEFGNPAFLHKAAFDYAIEHGLPCTCHAGEGDGAQSVADAYRSCNAHRIGHGTRLIEDPALMTELKAAGVAIECCITSNVQTHATRSFDTHPLRQYFDAGLKVSLNTDNRLMSDTNLVTEYGLAAKHLDFTFDELCRLARGGFENAFLPEAQRAQLLARVDTELDALRRSVA